MGGPRFKPAHICANPRHFGRHPRPTWTDPSPFDPAKTAWAIYQHRAAYAVTLELKTAGQQIPDLARELGEDPAWLMRKLHGQTPADLGDIMSWALHYGVHILPVFDASTEMQPTAPQTGHDPVYHRGHSL